jgi:hypothetical protein
VVIAASITFRTGGAGIIALRNMLAAVEHFA